MGGAHQAETRTTHSPDDPATLHKLVTAGNVQRHQEADHAPRPDDYGDRKAREASQGYKGARADRRPTVGPALLSCPRDKSTESPALPCRLFSHGTEQGEAKSHPQRQLRTPACWFTVFHRCRLLAQDTTPGWQQQQAGAGTTARTRPTGSGCSAAGHAAASSH